MENSEHHHGSSDWKFLIGFFIGGLIGAIVIFFLGTKEGKKMGKDLEEKGKDLLGELEDKLQDYEEKGKELIKRGEEIKDTVMEKVVEEKEVLTQSAKENVDDMLAKIEEIQKQGQAATANLRRKFKNVPKR